MTTRARRLIATVGLISISSMGVVSCSQEKPAVCTEAEQLRTSVNQLQNTNVSENGLGSLTTGLAQVRTDLSQFREAAKGQFAPQTDKIRSAADQVQGAVSVARNDPSAATLGQVGVALGGLKTSVQELGTAMKSTC